MALIPFRGKDRKLITVGQSMAFDFRTLQSAVDSITDAAADNPYVIIVAPGIYDDRVTIAKSNITLAGENRASTWLSPTVSGDPVVQVYDPTVVNTVENVEVMNLSIVPAYQSGGVPSLSVGPPSLVASPTVVPFQNISVIDCDIYGFKIPLAITGLEHASLLNRPKVATHGNRIVGNYGGITIGGEQQWVSFNDDIRIVSSGEVHGLVPSTSIQPLEAVLFVGQSDGSDPEGNWTDNSWVFASGMAISVTADKLGGNTGFSGIQFLGGSMFSPANEFMQTIFNSLTVRLNWLDVDGSCSYPTSSVGCIDASGSIELIKSRCRFHSCYLEMVNGPLSTYAGTMAVIRSGSIHANLGDMYVTGAQCNIVDAAGTLSNKYSYEIANNGGLFHNIYSDDAGLGTATQLTPVA